MSSIIRVLSDITINQIAAGEVIESPASVVKELVENSLDAGAKKIVVEVQGGGLHSIRISDDGIGMNRDDALLSLERHATSKIHDAKDLFEVQTMGFRGEALASIASISKMTLTTSLKETGVQLEVDGGKIQSVTPYPRNRGTTMEVRHLFFNVPARKKFQKSPVALSSEITRVITTLSLGYPDVSFELYHQENLAFSTPITEKTEVLEQLHERISSILGAPFGANVVHVDIADGPFSVKGIIGMPENTRHNRSGQYLFINRRPVVSPPISFAIRDAYGTRIGSDRHPIYVLHVDMPYHLLDVNVHPQKKEVRLSQEGWIKQVLQKAIQRSLEKRPEEEASKSPPVFADFSFEEPDFSFFARKEASSPAPFVYRESAPLEFKEVPLPLVNEKLEVVGQWSHYLLIDSLSLKGRVSLPIEEEGLCLVDLAAARSRILFEQLLNAHSEPLHKQGLLFPISFEMASFEASELVRALPCLSFMGYSITQSGPRSFLVDAIPSYTEESDVQKILEEMALSCISLDKEDIEGLEKKKMRKLAEVACRFVKFKKGSFSLSEGISIAEALLKTSSPCYCPVGNKTIIYLSEKNVGAYFSVKERGNAGTY
ncbi:MAG: DNA mismatch repair endonuclease MutL [Chlamydiae bacterium]|nr:DNA mismatch repair endonuclease MutL [Chlamydiota bacterium]